MNNVKDSKENEDYKIDFDRIAELIEKYKSEKTQGKIKGYTEEQTKVVFITPFFKALGWNTENRQNHNDSVSYEENIAGKRSDYGFSINGITKFYLEAKSLKEEDILFNTGYDKQAVNYAWLKSCSWAVLTNFETLAVYNADSGKAEWAFTLKSEEYLGENGRDKLKLLSKRGFEKGLLDTWALVNGKKPMKRPVDKQLLQDMIHFREALSKDIKKNNPHVPEDDIDEAVQRTLDRLVFIRNAEDRGYESKNLKSYYNQFSQKEKGHLIKKVRELYQHYRDVYNSGLFGKDNKTIHISDQVDISNEALSEVIQGLYSPEGAIYSYNFAVLDADVLGKIYEQYLGNILKQTPKRAKLEESKTHRKEQGIYYTPSYIVDYIVKNTVGEYIKTHTPEEIRKVRILDPACGSGSFLIRAYKELEGYWSKYYEKNKDISKSVRTVKQTKFNPDMEGNEIEFYSTKTEILKNNIFGVDLDPKAVEIAQLNLLLQISERKHRLPILQNNIKVGNSLIDDPSISHRAFKWEEEFPEIMKEGGFDIVIGNPPYISNWTLSGVDRGLVEYLSKEYTIIASGHWDVYVIFIYRALTLLHNNGYLSFIVPSSFSKEKYAKELRKLILEKYSLLSVTDFGTEGVFDNVARQYVIFVITKNQNPINKTELVRYENYRFNILEKVSQNNFLTFNNYTFRTDIRPQDLALLDKVSKGSVMLGSICCVNPGVVAHSGEHSPVSFTKDDVIHNVYESGYKKYVTGREISRYCIMWSGQYMDYESKAKYFHRPKFPELFERSKIIVRRVSGENNRLIIAYDENGYYSNDNLIHMILWGDDILKLQNPGKIQIYKPYGEFDLKFIAGIVGSRLISYLFSKFYATGTLQGTYSAVYPEDLRKIPIKIISKEKQNVLSLLVSQITKMSMKFCGMDNTNEKLRLKELINEYDQKIEEFVFSLYGISPDERKMIENNQLSDN